MTEAGITLLGLGPGNPALLTRQAWQILESAQEIYLRTRAHPVVADLPAQLALFSFDDLYERADSFEEVYTGIVQQILQLGQRPQGVIYAVPGHPLIAEATGPEILRQARQMGLPVRLVEGLSFLEPVFSAVGADPFPQTVLVDALELARRHVPSFPADTPALIAQIHSRTIASEVKLVLMETYPDEHPVKLVHAAGTAHESVEELLLFEIDRSRKIGLLTALYVPPRDVASSLLAFQEVIAHLRAPDGCPWDREQTHRSLRGNLLEETYEVLQALDSEDTEGLKEELGDLLLQIFMQAQIAAEAGEFNLTDVVQGIYQKIVRRHPHVFGDTTVKGVQEVLENWERLKAKERGENQQAEKSILDGVAPTLPALAVAEQYQARAARVGFEWPAIQGVLDKIAEEIAEVGQAADPSALEAEIGDLLFAVVNLARWHGVDPESALRQANQRFRQRFQQIEATARAQGKQIQELTLDEMEAAWQAAKLQGL